MDNHRTLPRSRRNASTGIISGSSGIEANRTTQQSTTSGSEMRFPRCYPIFRPGGRQVRRKSTGHTAGVGPPARSNAPAGARRARARRAFAGIMTGMGSGGRKAHVRHETAHVYHAARRRGGRVAAHGATRQQPDQGGAPACCSLSEAGFLTSTVARGPQKSRSADGPTPTPRRTRLLGVDRCEQLVHGAR